MSRVCTDICVIIFLSRYTADPISIRILSETSDKSNVRDNSGRIYVLFDADDSTIDKQTVTEINREMTNFPPASE